MKGHKTSKNGKMPTRKAGKGDGTARKGNNIFAPQGRLGRKTSDLPTGVIRVGGNNK